MSATRGRREEGQNAQSGKLDPLRAYRRSAREELALLGGLGKPSGNRRQIDRSFIYLWTDHFITLPEASFREPSPVFEKSESSQLHQMATRLAQQCTLEPAYKIEVCLQGPE
jgi:hypothetical protein